MLIVGNLFKLMMGLSFSNDSLKTKCSHFLRSQQIVYFHANERLCAGLFGANFSRNSNHEGRQSADVAVAYRIVVFLHWPEKLTKRLPWRLLTLNVRWQDTYQPNNNDPLQDWLDSPE